jgi:hypothetical protein
MENYSDQKILEIPYGSAPYVEFFVRHGAHVIPHVNFSFMNVTPEEGRFCGASVLPHKSLIQCTQDTGLSRVLVVPHAPGIFSAEITSAPATEFLAGLQEATPRQYPTAAVIEFQLNILAPESPSEPPLHPPLEKFPNLFSTAKLGNFFVLEPLAGQLPPSSPASFKIGQREEPWAYANPSLFLLERNSGKKTRMAKGADSFFCCQCNTGTSGETMVLCLEQGNSFSFLITWDVV